MKTKPMHCLKREDRWINDAYWLVMPWKLQDPGVTLSYVKTDTLQMGKQQMFYNLLLVE
jgi:hypothetical protein